MPDFKVPGPYAESRYGGGSQFMLGLGKENINPIKTLVDSAISGYATRVNIEDKLAETANRKLQGDIYKEAIEQARIDNLTRDAANRARIANTLSTAALSSAQARTERITGVESALALAAQQRGTAARLTAEADLTRQFGGLEKTAEAASKFAGAFKNLGGAPEGAYAYDPTYSFGVPSTPEPNELSPAEQAQQALADMVTNLNNSSQSLQTTKEASNAFVAQEQILGELEKENDLSNKTTSFFQESASAKNAAQDEIETFGEIDVKGITPTITALTKSNQLLKEYRQQGNEQGVVAIAARNKYLLEKIGGFENIDKYFDSREDIPEDQKQYQKQLAKESALNSMSPSEYSEKLPEEYVSPMEAGFAPKDVSDISSFNNQLATAATGNYTNVSKSMKNVLEGDPTFLAFKVASKDGTQSVKRGSRIVGGPEAGDVSGSGGGQLAEGYVGADGTFIPFPQYPPDASGRAQQNAMRDVVDKMLPTYAKQRGYKDSAISNQQNIQQIQSQASAPVPPGTGVDKVSPQPTGAPAPSLEEPGMVPLIRDGQLVSPDELEPNETAEPRPGVKWTKSPDGQNTRIENKDLGLTLLDTPYSPEYRQRVLAARGAKDPVESERKLTDSFEKQLKPMMDKVAKSQDQITADSDSADRMKMLLQRAAATGNMDLLGPGGKFNRWAERVKSVASLGILSDQDAEDIINEVDRLRSQGLVDIIKTVGTTAANTAAEQRALINATFNEDQVIKNVNRYIKAKEAMANRTVEANRIVNLLAEQGPLTGISRAKINRVYNKYLNSPVSSPVKINAEGTEFVDNPDFMTAEQFLGLELKAPEALPTATEALPEAEQVSPDVVAPTQREDLDVVSPTTTITPTTTGGGGGGPTAPLEPTPEGGILGGPSTQTQEIEQSISEAQANLDSSKLNDPQFRSAVEEAKQELVAQGEDPGFLDRIMDTITPEFVTNAADAARRFITTDAPEAINELFGLGEPEKFEERKQEVDARIQAGKELLDAAKTESPGTQILAEVLGMAAMSGQITSAGLGALTKLGQKFPKIAKAVEFFSTTAPKAATRTGRIAQVTGRGGAQAGVDALTFAATGEEGTAGERAVTGAVGSGVAQAGLAGLSKLLGPVAGKAVEMGRRVFGSPDPIETFAKKVAAGGGSPQSIMRKVVQAEEEGVNILTLLEPAEREIVENVLQSPEGRTLGEKLFPELVEQAEEVTAQAARQTEILEARSVPEIARQATTAIEEAIDASLSKVSVGTSKEQSKALSKAVGDIFTGVKKNSEKAIKSISNLVGKGVQKLPAARRIGEGKRALEQRIDDLAAIDNSLNQVLRGKKSVFRTAEEAMQDLNTSGDKILQNIREEVSLGEGAPDFITSVFDEVERKLVRKDYPGRNSFEYLANLREFIKKGGNKNINIGGKQKEQLLNILDSGLNQASKEAGYPGKFFSKLIDRYGVAAETQKGVAMYRDIFRKVNNELDAASPGSVERLILGNEDVVDDLVSTIGKSNVDNLRTNLQSIDKANKALNKIDSRTTTTAAKKMGIGEDLSTAIDFIGADKNIGKQLLKSENPAVIKQIRSSLPRAKKDLVSESILSHVKQLADDVTPEKAFKLSKRADVKPYELVGINEREWNVVKEAVGKEQADLLEGFFGKKISEDTLKEMVRRSGQKLPKEEGTISRTITRWMWRTGGGAVLDLLTGSAFNAATKNERKVLAKMLLDPDPNNLIGSFKKVADMLVTKETKAGIETVVKKGAPKEQTNKGLAKFIIPYWMATRNVSERQEEQLNEYLKDL